MPRLAILAAAVLALLPTAAPAQDEATCARGVVTIEAGGVPLDLDVRVADTTRERALGLSGLVSTDRPLEPGTGMLFVYPEPRDVSAFLNTTGVPIDIISFDARGRWLRAQENPDGRAADALAGGPGMLYALMLPGGAIADLSLDPETRLSGWFCDEYDGDETAAATTATSAAAAPEPEASPPNTAAADDTAEGADIGVEPTCRWATVTLATGDATRELELAVADTPLELERGLTSIGTLTSPSGPRDGMMWIYPDPRDINAFAEGGVIVDEMNFDLAGRMIHFRSMRPDGGMTERVLLENRQKSYTIRTGLGSVLALGLDPDTRLTGWSCDEFD